ncbi:unnamed protein product [Bemisia tabaci]|uniref:Protein sleepless n=1 Tax=Bemisia tabaci TaxID=7038 RepID=A0A9P0AG36_BEMTA|nr:PREDICTED: uncharacterized protein LOC109037358 [Bemisia tabaci]CAH0390446.1 unnamed protein product [Bemisia tabaci]
MRSVASFGLLAVLSLELFSLFVSVDGIKCWVCRSDNDPKCADPFDNSTLPITDCKEQPYLDHIPNVKSTMCRKVRQKVNGEWRYIRSCAYLGEPGIGGDERYCLMRTGSFNIFIEYCTCNTKDGCNSSSSIMPTLFVVAASILFAKILF